MLVQTPEAATMSVTRDFRRDWRRWTATQRFIGAALALLALMGPLMRLLTDLHLL
jgi:hypothetical protein